ncbi:MAG: 16S rRNA (cytosine(1402)-N(4))-methyltransferase RsmH [Candidatus Omnitrophica bacterium]|nr:16S rRNA (cytosine(1402)-N(4))-methyltransferase RsmH [Candidatus Omnitrophota bacterium]
MKGLFLHLPVLLRESIEHLALKRGDAVLDATLGGGGHAIEVLKKIGPEGKLIAVDRDPEALDRTKQHLKDYSGQIIYINENFRNIEKILGVSEVEYIDGAIFDLGVSSYQIDNATRGFSFLKDGPLDMRFDTGQTLTAREMVNKFGKDMLADIIRKYGEERYAGRVAGEIVASRKRKRIETTGELVEVIEKAVGRKYRNQKLHPACRTFQALRIYVNDELSSAEEAVGKTISYLHQRGRICVISFHSLEDRIIKNMFREKAREKKLALVTKKPITPGREEVLANPRARSAKLRVAEKL